MMDNPPPPPDGPRALWAALYGRPLTDAEWLIGTQARMLYDAARVIVAARCIRHWHDSGIDGMVVSAEHVRRLWEVLPADAAAIEKERARSEKVFLAANYPDTV